LTHFEDTNILPYKLLDFKWIR